MRTLEGKSKSLMAVPSAKNSGLDSTWNLNFEAEANTRLIDSAVRTGTVDFSTFISNIN
jgi:hypothetical protein